MTFTFGLRIKATLLASFFLILPWLGYQTILELEKMLRQGQEQTLIGTTRAVASALHERPNLFNTQASFLNELETGRDLYAYAVKTPIQIDGDLSDWKSLHSKSLISQQKQTIYQANTKSNNPISFRHMLAIQGEYLYGYLAVTDKYPVFRSKTNRYWDRNDHLIIAFSSPENILQRYIISVEKSGWFNAYKLSNNNTEPQREKQIQGVWIQTDVGYNIEFRFPRNLLGNKLGFSLRTTSNNKIGVIDNIIATSNTQDLQQLGTILTPSPEIDNILKGLAHSQSRIWIVDKHQRVLANSGDIHQADGLWQDQKKEQQSNLLQPLYDLMLSKPNNDFIDELQGATQLNQTIISTQPSSTLHRRLTPDNKAMILSATSPIFMNGKVMGFVVAEETTNGIRMLRNNALQKIFNILIAIIIVGTLLLVIFSANIASRITKLRDQTEQAIDEQGRLSAPFKPSTSGDEIGDLSRGLSDMVNRLRQYHLYLENLASRLSHELHTPVAVVRSSLENLALLAQDKESQKYIERSQTGILRLNRILTNMSEATRLEQSLQHGEKEIFSLNELLTGAVQGYQMTYPKQYFIFKDNEKTVKICADPDFIMQCLDKLINNAMEFSHANTAISINLEMEADRAIVYIENKGCMLPNNMEDELLNSMVSIRNNSSPDKTHLGLGLFIAKMICDFHQASINIANNKENSGVIVTLSFPLS